MKINKYDLDSVIVGTREETAKSEEAPTLNPVKDVIKEIKIPVITPKIEFPTNETPMLIDLGELESSNKDTVKNKLVFYEWNGKIEYFTETGKKYSAKFAKKTNQYVMLKNLAHNPGKLLTHDEIVKGFRGLRRDAESTNEERARHTVKAIRQKFKLSKKDDFFEVSYGYGLNCSIEIVK